MSFQKNKRSTELQKTQKLGKRPSNLITFPDFTLRTEIFRESVKSVIFNEYKTIKEVRVLVNVLYTWEKNIGEVY